MKASSAVRLSRVVCAVALLLGGAAAAGALQVGGLFSIGNLAFDPSRASTDTTFTGESFPWGISVYANQPVSDAFTVSLGVTDDPILRYTAYALFTYHGEFFDVGVGPSLGVFNSTTSPLKASLSASARIEWPGIAFLSYSGDNTIGAALVEAGDYSQARNDLALGFYVANAICSVNLLTRRYVAETSSGSTIDDFTEYSFKTDLFQKNVPYRILLTFGYQTLSKSFISSGATTTDGLGSLVVGTRLEANISDSFTYVFDLTSSVYTFGQDALLGLSNPGPSWLGGYLFRLSTGVQLNLDRLFSSGVK